MALRTQAALRRAASYAAAARIAELRALRYQLDPHFPFNALNTISGLVLEEDIAGAESTIDALSCFLRTTLALDAGADIPLADELALQRLYLDIETVRYADRLRVQVDVPEALAAARIPALLLQPLVENSIRHAVSRSTAPVRLEIRAWSVGDTLHVVVEDDGSGGATLGGHGIGLRNIEQRLMLRFEGTARFTYGPRPGGGFRTEIALPLHRDRLAPLVRAL